MKKMYLKYLLTVIFSLTSINVYAQSKSMELRTAYPPSYGAHSKIRFSLMDHSEIGSCKVGMMYFKNNGRFRMCQNTTTGTGVWQSPLLWQKNGENVFLKESTNRKIGIGTVTPEFTLSLENDGGIIAKGRINQGKEFSASGNGSNFIWYPRKGAFRAGVVNSGQWDVSNLKDNSFAAGYNNLATGYGSIALGYENKVSGYGGFASGYQTQALHVSGSNTFGRKTSCSGGYASAFGNETQVLDHYSAAFGNQTQTEDYSVAMGQFSFAKGLAMGFQANANPGVALGRAATSTKNIAIGSRSSSSGSNSVGLGTEAHANGNHASIAIGNFISTSANTAIVVGNYSMAKAERAIAIGNNVAADGEESFALGQFTTAQPYRSFVFGRYNIISGNRTSWVPTDPFFILGNGTGDLDRKNALTVLKNGNVGIKTATPKSRLHIMGVLEYADNATALANGLKAGDFYRTGEELKIVH